MYLFATFANLPQDKSGELLRQLQGLLDLSRQNIHQIEHLSNVNWFPLHHLKELASINVIFLKIYFSYP